MMKDPRDIILKPIVSEKSYALIERGVTVDIIDDLSTGSLKNINPKAKVRFIKMPRLLYPVQIVILMVLKTQQI